jgi:DNA-binding response OmpR family regulator
MSQLRKFLVIDDNPDSRFLLTKTLMRKFPSAAYVETGSDTTATHVAATDHLDAIILHRTADVPGLEMITLLREVNRDAPLVMVSGIDRSSEAMNAGASYFLLYDEWLRLGTVVAGLIAFKKPSSRSPFGEGEKDSSLSSV